MNNLHSIHKESPYRKYALKCENCKYVYTRNSDEAIKLYKPGAPYKGLHLQADGLGLKGLRTLRPMYVKNEQFT